MEKGTPTEALEKYLNENTIVVADSHGSSRTRLIATLIELGAKRPNIATAGSFAEASEEILKVKPRIVLADFELRPRSGLDLLEFQRQIYKDPRECLFVVITGNTSQAAVARAAEEDVDSFILKPYTLDALRKTLRSTCIAKLCPSEYIRLIEQGKDQLMVGKLDEAKAFFETAMGKSSSPTLACFYLGQVKAIREAIEAATESYQQGLDYNKIHYKCLVGLYELLISQKRHVEAYQVVKRLAQYFPANPKRLASVLRLAISTANFDDIESYYRTFVQIDERTDELVNYMCSAMSVTGKHYLKKKVRSRAIEVLDKGVITAAGRTKFIRYAVEALSDERLYKEAGEFLKRFPISEQRNEDYLTADLLVSSGAPDLGPALKKGLELLNSGVRNASVYRALVGVLLKLNRLDQAASTAVTAVKAWPHLREEFVDLLDGEMPQPGNEKGVDA